MKLQSGTNELPAQTLLDLSKTLFPWLYGPGDAAHRLDLVNVAAIVLPTPGYVVRLANPNGQAIDLIKWHDEIVREFLSELSTRLTHSVNSVPADEVTSHRYHPAVRQPRTAGAISHVYDLVQLVASQSNAFLTMAQYIEFGALLIGIGRWWKNRIVESGDYSAQQDRPIFTPEAIRMMCTGHAHEAHKARPKKRPSSFVREGYFGSADHPTGVELYTVHVPAKRGAYVYQVDGRGTLHDHYFVDANGVQGLPLPDWFGDAGVKQNLLAARQLDDPKKASGLT